MLVAFYRLGIVLSVSHKLFLLLLRLDLNRD